MLPLIGVVLVLGGIAAVRRQLTEEPIAVGNRLLYRDSVDAVYLGNQQLQKVRGVWLVDGYYADSDKVEQFLERLRQTVYAEQLSQNGACKVPLRLQDGHKEVLNICLGQISADGARQAIDGDKTFRLSRNIPLEKDWLLQSLQPLQQLLPEQSNFSDVDAWLNPKLRIISVANRLPALPFQPKKLQITSFDGVSIDGMVYSYAGQYWLQLSLGLTVMPQSVAALFAQKNDLLYRGWYFKLSAPEGDRLFRALP